MFTFSCRKADDPDSAFTVVADSRDVLRWEKAKSGRSVAKLLADSTVADSYVLAYLAAKREGHLDCAPAEFENDWLLIFGSDPAPDPTSPGR